MIEYVEEKLIIWGDEVIGGGSKCSAWDSLFMSSGGAQRSMVPLSVEAEAVERGVRQLVPYWRKVAIEIYTKPGCLYEAAQRLKISESKIKRDRDTLHDEMDKYFTENKIF